MPDDGSTPHHIEGNPGPEIFGGLHNEPTTTLAISGNASFGSADTSGAVAELPPYIVRGNATPKG